MSTDAASDHPLTPNGSHAFNESVPAVDKTTNQGTALEGTIAEYIWLIYPWLYCLVGIPLNIATMVVMFRKWMRTSYVVYVTYLSAVDAVALLHKLISMHTNQLDIVNTPAFCRYTQYVVSVTSQLSSWILVLLSFERAIVVKFPFARLGALKLRRTLMTIGLVTGFLMLANFHLVFTITSYDGSSCGYEKKSFEYIRRYWFVINSLLFSGIPTILLIMTNTVIIVVLYHRKVMSEEDSGEKSLDSGRSTEYAVSGIIRNSDNKLSQTGIHQRGNVDFVDEDIDHIARNGKITNEGEFGRLSDGTERDMNEDTLWYSDGVTDRSSDIVDHRWPSSENRPRSKDNVSQAKNVPQSRRLQNTRRHKTKSNESTAVKRQSGHWTKMIHFNNNTKVPRFTIALPCIKETKTKRSISPEQTHDGNTSEACRSDVSKPSSHRSDKRTRALRSSTFKLQFKKATRSILLASTAYILLTSPMSLLLLYSMMYKRKGLTFALLANIAFALRDLNHIVNCFIYSNAVKDIPWRRLRHHVSHKCHP